MTNSPIFPKHDPASPEFWDVRFSAHFTPWDQGAVPANFRHFVESSPKQYRVLIPGCGAGYEVRLLAERGWPVTAIDFSSGAVAAAQRELGALGKHVRELDFFGKAVADIGANLIYERAFLCALPRRLWHAWAARVAELLAPGGLLVGYFFESDSPKGPPFGLAAGELDGLLAAHFTKLAEAIPTDSIAIFRGHEKWMVWQRRVASPP